MIIYNIDDNKVLCSNNFYWGEQPERHGISTTGWNCYRAPYTAKMAMGHVASSAPGASQMYMSVPIGSCGSYDPVITLKPLWGSPGTELSTWSIGSLCCIRAIQRSRIASRPLRSYTAIQRYTALYTIQLYIAIHYTGYTTPLCPTRQMGLAFPAKK